MFSEAFLMFFGADMPMAGRGFGADMPMAGRGKLAGYMDESRNGCSVSGALKVCTWTYEQKKCRKIWITD